MRVSLQDLFPTPSGAVKLVYVPLLVVGGLVALAVLAVIVSALSNIGLPTHSKVVDRLSDVDKARLAEYIHTQPGLMGVVWRGPGGGQAWGDVKIPAIVHNETYVFLVGYPNVPEGGVPPDGWMMMPREEQRGGPWEVVPDDTFFGEPYYRQPLPTTGGTPENFTVKVGDVWVATLYTKEYAAVQFYRGFGDQLPPFLRGIFPYRLMWTLLMGPSENYIAALAHEAFHAYQGTVVPDKLASAESLDASAQRYDWSAAREDWESELDLLYAAANTAYDPAASEADVRAAAQAWLAQRDLRRQAQGLTATGIDYERQREWLEGLAKYAELTLGATAHEVIKLGDYTPVAALADDAGFHNYRGGARHWSQQLSEVKRMASQDETRFYYTGFAQGVILDRLMPGWKARALDEGVWLEALVAEAAGAD